MEQLLELIRTVVTAEQISSVAAAVRAGARALVGADGVTLVLRDEDECFYLEEDAIAPLWRGRRFAMRACISGWVMHHAQIAVIADIYADARIPHDAYRPTFVKSLVMVPAPQDKPIAAMGAYWAEAHEATWSEQHTLQALANAVGIAIKNLSHFGALRSGALTGAA